MADQDIHGANIFENIITILIIISSSKPGGSYISLVITAYSIGGHSSISGNYCISFISFVCFITSFSVICCFSFTSFVKRNSFVVYVYYTGDDSIKNTANTSKNPNTFLTLCVDDLMLNGGDMAALKMLREKN